MLLYVEEDIECQFSLFDDKKLQLGSEWLHSLQLWSF